MCCLPPWILLADYVRAVGILRTTQWNYHRLGGEFERRNTKESVMTIRALTLAAFSSTCEREETCCLVASEGVEDEIGLVTSRRIFNRLCE